jgi:sortase A
MDNPWQQRFSRLRTSLSEWTARPLWRGITPRRAWPYALIVLGGALVIYVGAQYGTMAWQQHQLARRWEQQYRADQNAAPGTTAPQPAADDGLMRVSIPKIDLDAIVVEGTTYKKLLVGPGHIQTTAQPGEVGNAVITGHRDTFFRHIYELNKGDEILVRRRGEVFRFQVTGKKIVEPTDVSVTNPSPDARLTLITCYPTYYIGPAPERLVVFSKLLDHAPEGARASTTTPTSELTTTSDTTTGTSH